MSHPIGWRTLPTRARLAAARRLRGVSIDLDALAATVASLTPGPRILEIGCGKGSLALALLRALPPGFEYLGVDPGESPGRRFATARRLGDLPDGAVTFRRLRSAELLPAEAGRFDLVLLVDVLHHAPDDERRPVLRDAARLVAPGGLVVVVDWARGRSWADPWCLLTCRWIPRDEHARFLDRAEFDDMLGAELGELKPVITTGVPPRRNNVLSVRRRN
ncbi:class I SAM-dependent methyltransferase [Nakamurella flava]|uniref:Class I SAM-dependent methyltransferase n=1 Tax=Nakamurella flava TaxID=2576308 RepID=A0A4U6Q627_9ACTN|nr:class I SAM-dependent methyltransferase [Nakamurella flava]TKV56127.1 class I SAM-dependent methyltransferase [Nakamurella flava]